MDWFLYVNGLRHERVKEEFEMKRKRLFKIRSSRPEVFCRKGVLSIFTKFTGKQLCQSLYFRSVIFFQQVLLEFNPLLLKNALMIYDKFLLPDKSFAFTF